MKADHTPKNKSHSARRAVKKLSAQNRVAGSGLPLFLQSLRKSTTAKNTSTTQPDFVQRQDDETERNRLGQVYFDKSDSTLPQASEQNSTLKLGEHGPKTQAQITSDTLSSIVYSIKEEMRLKKAWGKPTDLTIVIEGLASQEGTPKLNQKLSERRAKVMKQQLLARLKKAKVDTSKITIITKGIGTGQLKEDSYHLDRKASVYILKTTIKLNKPGSIIKPRMTENDKIRYIRELIMEGDKTALKAEQTISAITLMTSMASDVLPLPGYTDPKQLERESYLKIYDEYMQLKARE